MKKLLYSECIFLMYLRGNLDKHQQQPCNVLQNLESAMTSKWRRRRRITSPSAHSGRLCWTQWSSPAGTNCSLKPSNRTAGTTERLTGKPKRPFWKSTRDLANSPVSIGRSQLVWRMPWGCWLEYNDERMLLEAWNAATEEFSEDWASTTVHQIQGARITLSASYNQKDWGAMQEWISFLFKYK